MATNSSSTPAEICAEHHLSNVPGKCGCGEPADTQKIDVKVPGTVHSFLRGGPFYLCAKCRVTRRGRWRKSQWY